MEPLPVVPLESCSAEGLVFRLQRASQRHGGLLLFQPGAEQAAALLALKLRPHRDYESYEAVAPHEAPAAAAALHKLGRKFTKAAMQRVGEHPYLLHPHLDDLANWLHPTAGGGQATHSKILISRSSMLEEHVDRGLFNFVLGTAADLESIHVTIAGERVGMKGLLPVDPPPGLLGLLIPGYTLQCLDPTTPAVPHGVDAHSVNSYFDRATLVLQWRLHPDFGIGETTVGELLEQFEVSVRAAADQNRADWPDWQAAAQVKLEAKRAAERAASEPKLPPAENFNVTVKTLDGKSIKLQAHPLWTVANIKWSMEAAEGTPIDQQRIIFAGKQLEEHNTLQEYGVESNSEMHMVCRLRGD